MTKLIEKKKASLDKEIIIDKDIENEISDELLKSKRSWDTFGEKFKLRNIPKEKEKEIKKILGDQFHLFRKLYSFETPEKNRLKIRNILVVKNSGLVKKFSNTFRDNYYLCNSNTTNIDDLIQSGYFGLLRSLEDFDPCRKNHFSSYAYHWIICTMRFSLINDNPVKISVGVKKKFSLIEKTKEDFFLKHNRYPTYHEIANKLNFTVEYLDSLNMRRRQVVSLNRTFFNKKIDNGSFSLSETIESKTISPLDNVLEKESINKIYLVLGKMKFSSPRDELILRYRFGFETGRKETLSWIGEKLGLCKERIRQIEKSCLKKIRLSTFSSQLKNLL